MIRNPNLKTGAIDGGLTGVSGELYIGGAGLARGYLNRAALTAEKFVPNPFMSKENETECRALRLYRTGDLARYLPDGNIEFLGRIDDQVKIRGFRIEPGEIETRLNQYKEVSQAIVLFREEEGHTQLVAYVVPEEEALATSEIALTLNSVVQVPFNTLKGASMVALTEGLRNYLACSLPEYMIPAFFVFIDRVPLNSSGKIDKKILPAPDLSIRQVGGVYIEPQTTLQQQLATIWSEVLRIKNIGIHDNFFRIGGDSIISIQLVAKARQLGIYLAVKDIFNYPTIATLSLVAKAQESALIKPVQGLIEGDIPLTPIQHWFFEQSLSNIHHYNQASLLQIEQVDVGLLQRSFELLIAQHDVLSYRYNKKTDGTWQQNNLAKEDINSIWSIVDLSAVKDGTLGLRIEQEANTLQQSLDIEKGPLIRVSLFNCGARPARLLIVIHHLVVDGVSWRILLEDLERVYQALQNNKIPTLAKTHSFQQWSYVLANYAKSKEFNSEIAYWQGVENTIKPLPVDFDKGAISALHTITVSLSKEETTALLQKAPKAYRTQINDLLLTALTLTIGDWTEDYSFSLSLEGHGREDVVPEVDLSRTLGWFTSIFPVFLQIKNHKDLGEAIKTVKEVLRQIPHKGIGYGIAKYLSADNVIANGDQPSLSFNYLGQWDNIFSQRGCFSFAQEFSGNSVGEGNLSPHLLTINSEVREGNLCFAWSYSTNHYHLNTINKLTRAFVQRLVQIIQHCCQDNVFGYTPSDFKLIIIPQSKIDTSFGIIANLETVYPLSPMQGGLLFQVLYAPDSDVYFVQMLLELAGELQVNALKQAWLKVLERHESLRVSFMWKDLEEPVQIIHNKVDLTWHEEDWQKLSVEEQIQQLGAYITKDRAQGFDFTQAPLMRWSLFKYSNKKHYLLWSHHHILSDGWSGPIILNEVKSIYDSLVNKKAINLPTRRPYGDYIAWLSQQDQEKAENYWKHTSEGATPTKLASRDIKEDQTQTQAYGECAFDFNEENSQKLLAYAGELGVTLNTVLQTLWGIVLSVYTGQSNVVFGVVVSGRQIDLPGIEEMVGIFINTLPLRIQLRGFESLEDLIKHTQNQMVGMQEHAYVPLWKIQAQQKEGGSGLFDSTYVYQNYPIQPDSGQSSKLAINHVRGIEKAEYKLGINLSYENCLRARINYDEAYFSQDYVKQLLAHFEQLILTVINNPSQKIGELTFLIPEELKQLTLWNETQHDYPADMNICELFEEAVKRVPDTIAIVYESQQITYSCLNERANQLAHYLRGFGVEAEVPVAIAIDRSIEMVIGILGVLKAGGAYVPLDVSYPPERLEYMLEDSGVPFIVSRTKELETLSVGPRIVINLDEIRKSLEEQPKTLPKHELSPENLAYIIYTSGSTGRPKGVGVSHGSAVHLSLAQQKAFSYNSDTKTLQFASISFDASVSELGCTFAQGSTLVICDNKDIIEVEKTIYKQQINQMTLPPSILKEMSVDVISKHSKQIVVAGEAPDIGLITMYQKNSVKVVNAYGPTEGTVCASIGVIESTNHIGRPIWNTQMHILDKHLNPIPIGASGEIYIGGVGLARGYVNKPGFTAERFIPNPFGDGSRLYKTGDLGRYLPDGNIEFLGRIDHQLKLRGFRIELGEIEGTLEASNAVQQAIVLCREDIPGQKRLVAYVVPKNKEDSGLVESLQSLCQSRLPDYMHPSQWVVLESLLLTANGKIDRKALPAPDLFLRLTGDEYVVPQTSLEHDLCSIWKDVLQVEKIGIHDNFFKLGGHSLLATQVISRIRHTYNIDIPLRSLFEQPTIATLSQVVDSLRKRNILFSLPPLMLRERKDPIPLSFAQTRLWFLDQLLPEIALYNIALAFKLKGALNTSALEKALNTLIERHESLRTIFPSIEGEAHQSILPKLTIDLAESSINLTHLKKKEKTSAVEKVAQQEAVTPFNVSSDPLIRIKLLILAKEEYIFLITLHHIISDGWSMKVFFKELSDLYYAYVKEIESPLPALPIQYADFALWQREWLQGEALEQQLSYWKQQLSDIPDLLELPVDKPRPKEPTYKGATYGINLSVEIKDQLNQLAHQHQASLFMALLAVFQILLYRYTGQKDIVVGSPIANRHYKEVEGLIGFFVNTLALRTTFDGNETFQDVLNQIKETTLQAYQHQDVPFEQLVDHLNVSRALNRNPVFQVMFTLENATQGEPLVLEQIQAEPFYCSYPISKFDLSLNVYDGEGTLRVGIDYATDLFEAETIERMGGHFKKLIEGIIRNPNQDIQAFPLLTEGEEHQFLIEWNDTKADYPEDKMIHQLFEEQVRKTSNNIAVIYEGQELTYQQLNECANQLAHHLRSLGVKPDTLVAIAVERSLEMIIGLLGILKAGGAYVPLDPNYPQERLQFMLDDTNAPILITQTHLNEKFRVYSKTTLNLQLRTEKKELFIEERSITEDSQIQRWISPSEEYSQNPKSLTTHYNLAYAIYTSGSTGKPKGVMITQGGLLKSTYARLKYYPSPPTNFLLLSSISFDSSIVGIFWSLLCGAALVLSKGTYNIDANSIFEQIEEHQVSHLLCVPSLHKILLELQKKCINTKSLLTIIIAGEKCDDLLVENHKKYFARVSLFNEYGPTEACVWSSVECLYAAATQTRSNKITIGRPISNTQIYILDTQLNPVPVGISGEIYIGGVGLARGYLNHPDLTADRFIPNPFVSQKADHDEKTLRLYRTGDLARYLSDGNIQFLGRIDDQVKIRGFRIELGEIEAALLQYPTIKEAVVIVQRDSSGDKKLVAYLVLKGGEEVEFSEIRIYLQQILAGYMVPATFVQLDEIPLTANGKINRKGLPAPGYQGNEGEYVAPRTEIEEKLCKIWKSVLKIERIGIYDNFFELGGHSLLVTQLAFKLKEKLNLYIPLREFFNQLTIERLASFMKSGEIRNIPTNLKRQIEKDIEVGQKVSYKHNGLSTIDTPQSILVTGANGFVGIHLIGDLISRTKAKIYCLIRAKNLLHARERFNETISYYSFESLRNEPRIILLVGDLSQPQLGLDNSMFRFLSKEIDHIYHNGAFVHHIYDYFQLRGANVLSTVELLKLAAQERPKHFSYISTLSTVFDVDERNKTFLEQFPTIMPQGAEGGYPISKWVSEKILSEANQRGVDISIYRLPQILGRSLDGICPIYKNHFMLMIKGCIEMGYAPDIENDLNTLPVDFAAKFITDSSLTKECRNQVFNLSLPYPPSFKQIFQWLKEFGCTLSIIPYKDWKAKIISISKDNSFFPLLSLYMESPSDVDKKGKEELGTTYENTNFLTFLSTRGVTYPNMDKDQFCIYFKYLMSSLDRI